MKNAILFAFALILSSTITAQTKDSIVTQFESDAYKIIKNFTLNTYQITSKKSDLNFSNLKYIGSVGDSYQVIDANNEIFILDAMTLEKKEKAENLYWLCGTVPHYTLAVKEQKREFIITKDETFFDMTNQEPAEELMRISKKKADKIIFINGENTFNYSSNFSYTTSNISPTTIILVKKGKYTVLGEEEHQYDSIDFAGYSPTLKYSIDNLYGFHNITEAKYKEISDFQDNLARVTTVEGKKIIIDIEGNEYF